MTDAREVQLGVIEFHSDRLNPGLRQRFYEVIDRCDGLIVDCYLMDIAAVLKEFGYDMRIYGSKLPIRQEPKQPEQGSGEVER